MEIEESRTLESLSPEEFAHFELGLTHNFHFVIERESDGFLHVKNTDGGKTGLSFYPHISVVDAFTACEQAFNYRS